MTVTLQQIPVIVIIGIISLYFLISGVMALVKRRMTVHNPHHDSPPTSVDGLIFNLLKRRAKQDYPVPENFGDRSKYAQINGREATLRALFHLAMGLLSLAVLLCFLMPELAEKCMGLFL